MEEGVKKRKSCGAACSATNCTNNHKKCPTKSFFRFPKDPQRSKRWVINCRRKDLMERTPEYLHQNCRICSDHFEAPMFLNDLKNRLQPHAVPTLFNVPNPPQTVFSKRRRNSYKFREANSKKRLKDFTAYNDTVLHGALNDNNDCCVQTELQNTKQSDNENCSFQECVVTIQEFSSENENADISKFPNVGSVEIASANENFTEDASSWQCDLIKELENKIAVLSHNLAKAEKRNCSLKRQLRNVLPKITVQQKSKTHRISQCVVMEAVRQSCKSVPCLLIENEFNHTGKNAHRKHFSNESKQFFQKIFFYSPQCYRFLSKHLTMPSCTALKRWSKKQIIYPGDFNTCINGLKEMHGQKNLRKICCLSLKEIRIKPKFCYNSNIDEIVGFEDYGSTKTPKIASSALIIMATGILVNWNAPVGYIFTSGSCNYRYARTLLFAVLEKMEQAQFDIRLVICELGNTFQRLAHKLGVTENEPSFQHCGKSYYFMYDTQYLLRSTRNSLLTCTASFGGYTASWADIIEVYEKDLVRDFKFLPKITEQHVRPKASEKLKVKLATQVFSHSMAVSIEYHIACSSMQPSATGTAKFCAMFDKAFDCLNSLSLVSCNPNHNTLNPHIYGMEFFEEFIAFLQNLKFFKDAIDVTHKVKCVVGWIVTVKSIMQLWNDLKSHKNVKFLLTRRLGVEGFQKFFNRIQQRGGSKCCPTPFQFTKTFSEVARNQVLMCSSSRTNDCDGDRVSHAEAIIKLNQRDLIGIEYDKMSLYYVAGFLLAKLREKHSCEICQPLVKNFEDLDILLEFMSFKQHELPPGSGLTIPSDLFVNYLKRLEAKFIETFPKVVGKPQLVQKLLIEIQDIDPPVACFPKVYLCILFIRIRICCILKYNNVKIKEHIKCKNFSMKVSIC